jgi:hypothetical protein
LHFVSISRGEEASYCAAYRHLKRFAAVASAIAAGFSAYAAIHTFSYLARQEELARQQLKATYLSNLYSKQVDIIAAAVAADSTFTAIVFINNYDLGLCTHNKECEVAIKENQNKVRDAAAKLTNAFAVPFADFTSRLQKHRSSITVAYLQCIKWTRPTTAG